MENNSWQDDEFTIQEPTLEMPVEVKIDSDIIDIEPTPKRGIRVINEAVIYNPLENENTNIEPEENYVEIQNPLGLENEPSENDVTEESASAEEKNMENEEINQDYEVDINELQVEEKSDNNSEEIKEEIADMKSEEDPLDIAALINPYTEENNNNESSLSINSMFSNTNESKNDNIVTSEDLEAEWNKFVSEMDKRLQELDESMKQTDEEAN